MTNAFIEHGRPSTRPDDGHLPEHVIDAVREAVPPSIVIGRYTKLKKSGREQKGLSPFGRERTPSFYVNDAKRCWKDWSSGQGGDVFTFLMQMEGVSFREAVVRCAEIAGINIPGNDSATAPISPEAMAEAVAEREERRQAELAEEARAERFKFNLAMETLRDSRAFKMGDGSPPALFFEKRGLVMPAHMSPRALLFHPNCLFGGGDEKVHHPALVGVYRDVVTDKITGISRRALAPDGRGILIDGKKTLSLGSTKSSVIKLTADEDVEQGLHLAEGITSAIAAAMLNMVPIWAAGGAETIAHFLVLPGIDALTIIADNDLNGTGQKAANKCAARWRDAGREARIALPDTVGTDLADVVTNGRRHG